MSCSCCTSSCSCACHSFTPATGEEAACRARNLINYRDKARDMYARYGLRLYGVRIVKVAAIGVRRRGDGVDNVIAAWDILPVPEVVDLATLTQIVSASQVRETGTVLVRGISGTYSEDFLLGRGTDGTPVASEEAVYWELQFADPFGRPSGRRRMVAETAPSYDGVQGAYQITLRRAYEGRGRDGVPREGGG